ncbi:hypothetical protein AGDE_15973 [Angomonas deanei]|uniref:Trichohyalin-plectin-homology domain-containing protein n=1 Tax=Angomonas deanei TaxID=59799 RepID=A0A7G2CL94_9TRYP|nr:hypothetical protein AGDE_15973 [Angomonas deanei]CAD2220596.1 hypothetical protein, conserved [Angomonas deanei]|eukprot:EPY17984.1 hypothetical protein AGDE_15973 [Angomonas deanei]
MLERMKNEEADQGRQAAAKRNEAARRIDAENRRIADERKAERMARQSEDNKLWDGYFRSAEEGDAEREREKVNRLMEENRALAAQRQQERLLQNKRDQEYESAVQRYAERAMEREKSCELKKKAHERKLYEDLQRQAEERRALDKHESGDGLNFYPVSSDTESQLERKKKLEAVQKLQEENYKLAEQKRLQKRAEFEEELRRAKESTQNAAQAIEEEKR